MLKFKHNVAAKDETEGDSEEESDNTDSATEDYEIEENVSSKSNRGHDIQHLELVSLKSPVTVENKFSFLFTTFF